MSCLFQVQISSQFNIRRGPNFIIDPPMKVEFLNTNGAKVHCRVDGFPSPEVRWRTSNGDVVQNIPGLRTVLQNGTLILEPFDSEMYRQEVHANTYFCEAFNTFGRIISQDVTIRAAMLQGYSGQVYDKYVIFGNTAVFHCRVPSYVGDDVKVVSWETDEDETIITSKDVNKDEKSKYTVFEDGYLHVQKVSKLDDGKKFWCNMKHQLYKNVIRSTTSGTLHVKEPRGSLPPQILHRKQEVRAVSGSDANIPCVAEGYPSPHLVWFIIDSRGERYKLEEKENRILIKSDSLYITNVTINDAGLYECFVSNSVGSQRVKMKLIISSYLEADISPSERIVDIGKPVSLHCKVTGGPIEQLYWLKNGERIQSGGENEKKFQIDKMSREDGGMYQCMVRNTISSVQATAQLIIGDIYPEILKKFKPLISQPGPIVSIMCAANGSPRPKIKWMRDGYQLDMSQNYKISSYISDKNSHSVTSHLNISHIKSTDGGLYRCEASNKAGSSYHEARLDVYGLPGIRSMPNISITAENSFLLRCHAYGYPIDEYIWKRDDIPLENTTNQSILKNGTLVFKQAIDAVHAGKYTCIAKNRHGQSAAGHFWVNILVKPVVAKIHFPENVRAGMNLGLYCFAMVGSQPMTKQWLKDGRKISVRSDVVVIETVRSSILEIKRVTRNHNGNYTCKVENDVGSSSYTAVLQVEASPEWRIKPANHEPIAIYKSHRIDCKATAHPAPSVTWKRKFGSEYVEISSNDQFHIYENGSLEIQNATETLNGDYQCVISNGIPPDLNRNLFLSVEYPPRFGNSTIHLKARVNEKISIICIVYGKSPISVQWIKKSKILDNKDKYVQNTSPILNGIGKNSRLTIKNLQRTDNGTYECRAINDFGVSSLNYFFTVEAMPGPVEDVHLIGFDNKSVLVSWEKPKENGNNPVTEYFVEYFLKAESKFTHRVIRLNPNSRSLLLKNIQTSKHYNLKVVASNKIGPGENHSAIAFILSKNGSIILASDSIDFPTPTFDSVLVLLIVPSVIVVIFVTTVIVTVFLIAKKRKRQQLSRPSAMALDKLNNKKWMEKPKESATGAGIASGTMIDEKQLYNSDRYGRLLAPPTGSSVTYDCQTYKVDDSKTNVVPSASDGYYSEVSPYATFHLADTLEAKDKLKGVELRTFSSRHSVCAEMSSAL